MPLYTVKHVNFESNVILQISWKSQIYKTKLMQNSKLYIDGNGKYSIVAKLRARKRGNNFQFKKFKFSGN